MAKICGEAGLQIQKEEAIPQHPELIPADILIGGLIPSGPMALDFTEWSRQSGTTGPIDMETVLQDKR